AFATRCPDHGEATVGPAQTAREKCRPVKITTLAPHLVGLTHDGEAGQADEACRESRDRVRAAFLSRGFAWPNRRITVNLAPSGERKGVAGLDLVIATAVLIADEQLPAHVAERLAFVAELGLDGSLRSVIGAAPLVAAVRDHRVVVARGNGAAARAAVGGDLEGGRELAPGLLPALTDDQALSCTMVHSAAHVSMSTSGRVTRPPFRSPHHSISLVGLIGGGTSAMRPGEISLASEGVLFLDELGEFAPSVLDALRQPLEEGVVHVSRARTTLTFPARFLLVAAANPCPCGAGAPGVCVCDDAARAKYVRRFSGPLLDRFDLRVSVGLPRVDDLVDGGKGETSAMVAARVLRARAIAVERNGTVNSTVNAKIAVDDLDTVAPLAPAARALLRRELEVGRLSGRGLHRVRRVARTIADLDGAPVVVGESHVATALQLRTGLGVLMGGR
ncbi:MAG: YifB family Mg chelatase-like AAA ATPase, partial [Actinomycetota bacterium]